MHFTIKQDSPKTLCAGCRSGQIVTYADGKVEVICHDIYPPTRLHGPVTACSEFADRNVQSRAQLEDIAWILEIDKRKQICGFVPPKIEKE